MKKNNSDSCSQHIVGNSVTIEVEIAYWRKFNALHRWMTNNCKHGVENCEKSEITPEKLKELYSIILRLKNELKLRKGKVINGYLLNEEERIPQIEDGKVIANFELAIELLPTQEGFFFGSTDYDEYYYGDIVYTEKILKNIVEAEDFEEWDYYYYASW